MRVVVAMSGGVDSSVAALCMHEAGHEVIGISLRLWDYGSAGDVPAGSCCSPDDLYDARRVAERLGFPFYVINTESDFRRYVVDGFADSYLRGETPNPCVHCNDTVKFERLLLIADALGAEMLATGHYARKALLQDGRQVLRRAADAGKDQTYFLFRLDENRLRRILFPLGDLTKTEVRALAEAAGLPTASKHDSQELCFVPDNDYARFLEQQGAAAVPGDIVDHQGNTRGRHRGLFHYTIGQRRGLGIASPEPLYVLGLDLARNRLLVGPDDRLFRSGLIVRDVSWIAGEPEEETELQVRIRSRAREVPARIRRLDDGRTAVTFAEPQRAITPGQACVFYQGELVVGGGWIAGPLEATAHERPVPASSSATPVLPFQV